MKASVKVGTAEAESSKFGSETFRSVESSSVAIYVPSIESLKRLSEQPGQFDTALLLKPYELKLKRLVDLCGALMALAVFLVPMIFIAIAIKLESNGPVFYRQTRVGLGGRLFKIWKFRSMRTDAEKSTGAVWATSNDNRRTRVGAFLRRTSLDELPQLINVFMGEMSLVGPRPERPMFVEQFRHEVPEYLKRHSVPVGVTGLAQIKGFRGNTCIFTRVKYDLEYARKWSPLLDIKILFGTIFSGFINKNAY